MKSNYVSPVSCLPPVIAVSKTFHFFLRSKIELFLTSTFSAVILCYSIYIASHLTFPLGLLTLLSFLSSNPCLLSHRISMIRRREAAGSLFIREMIKTAA